MDMITVLSCAFYSQNFTASHEQIKRRGRKIDERKQSLVRKWNSSLRCLTKLLLFGMSDERESANLRAKDQCWKNERRKKGSCFGVSSLMMFVKLKWDQTEGKIQIKTNGKLSSYQSRERFVFDSYLNSFHGGQGHAALVSTQSQARVNSSKCLICMDGGVACVFLFSLYATRETR